jgi:hypothetical protein
MMEGEQTLGSVFHELNREIETTLEELQKAAEKLATIGLVRIIQGEDRTLKVTEKGYAFFGAESDAVEVQEYRAEVKAKKGKSK